MPARAKPFEISFGQKVAAVAGIAFVVYLESIAGLRLSDLGALSAGFFYGVGGVGGGLITYEAIQRLGDRLGWGVGLLAGLLTPLLWFQLVVIAYYGLVLGGHVQW